MDSNQNRVRHLETKKRKIFIKKLPKEADEGVLNKYFSQFGNIESVNLLRSFKTQQSRRVGHVTFRTQKDAEQVLKHGEPHVILGELIECEQCLLPDEIKKVKSKQGSIKTEILHNLNPMKPRTFMSFDHFKSNGSNPGSVNGFFPLLQGVSPLPMNHHAQGPPNFNPGHNMGTPQNMGPGSNHQQKLFNFDQWSNGGTPQQYQQGDGNFIPPHGNNFGGQPGFPPQNPRKKHSYHEPRYNYNNHHGNGGAYFNQQQQQQSGNSNNYFPHHGYHQPHQYSHSPSKRNQIKNQQMGFNQKNGNSFKNSLFSTEASSKTYEDQFIKEINQEIEKERGLNITSKQEMIIQLKKLKKEREKIDEKIRELEEKIKDEDEVKSEEDMPDDSFLGFGIGIGMRGKRGIRGKIDKEVVLDKVFLGEDE